MHNLPQAPPPHPNNHFNLQIIKMVKAKMSTRVFTNQREMSRSISDTQSAVWIDRPIHCVNSESFSKWLFSLVQPSCSPAYKKVNLSSTAGRLPAQFILSANSFFMRIQSPSNCLAVDLSYILCICIHLWPLYLFIADRSPPPSSIWWQIFWQRQIGPSVRLLKFQYTPRLSFALRKFNCRRINRGWC